MEYGYVLLIWSHWSINTTNDAALAGKNIGWNKEVGKDYWRLQGHSIVPGGEVGIKRNKLMKMSV